MKNRMVIISNFNKRAFMFFLILIISMSFYSQTNAQGRRGHSEKRYEPRIGYYSHNYERVDIGTRRYFYRNGSFYRRTRRGFNVIAAPIGARIRVLPYGFVTFRIGSLDYFYYNGVYYNFLPDQNVYVVVQKPANADNNSNLKLDQVKLYNGSVLYGVFQGATDSTITLRVGNQNQDINISNIISINFAPFISDSTQQ